MKAIPITGTAMHFNIVVLRNLTRQQGFKKETQIALGENKAKLYPSLVHLKVRVRQGPRH